MARPGVTRKYSHIAPSGVIRTIGQQHRVVRDALSLKYGLDELHGTRDGAELWLPVFRTTLRNDLICRLLDDRLVSDGTTLAELVEAMPAYVGGPSL